MHEQSIDSYKTHYNELWWMNDWLYMPSYVVCAYHPSDDDDNDDVSNTNKCKKSKKNINGKWKKGINIYNKEK